MVNLTGFRDAHWPPIQLMLTDHPFNFFCISCWSIPSLLLPKNKTTSYPLPFDICPHLRNWPISRQIHSMISIMSGLFPLILCAVRSLIHLLSIQLINCFWLLLYHHPILWLAMCLSMYRAFGNFCHFSSWIDCSLVRWFVPPHTKIRGKKFEVNQLSLPYLVSSGYGTSNLVQYVQ